MPVEEVIMPFVTVLLFGLVGLFGLAFIVSRFYIKVQQGFAMIVNTLKSEPEVTFTGRLVWPVIHKKEFMDISLKTLEVNRRGSDGLICKDNIRADITVGFFVRVNKTRDDVMKVAQAIGCERASDRETLEELFSAKFSEALKTVGKQMEFEDLYRERDKFRDKIIAIIGNDLNGYVLEDAAIDYLEQTPVSQLDKNNILDAQGIRKITELTAVQHVRTNELERDEQMQIKKKDVEAQEMILELERQQADAEARQRREIETVKAREEAEIERITAEERLKAERAKLETDQELEVQEQNKQREVEVAEKNRQRAVAIEAEKVERVRQLEAISREKEVDLQNIAKEKAVEEEKRLIADVVRERVIVDRSVAEEEENIKKVREVSEAERAKQVLVIQAEAQAEEALVKELKAAEAAEQRATHEAREKMTLANADLEISAKDAEAAMKRAEGVKAEQAAPGLAEAEVQIARADAAEKEGMAEAAVLREKMSAEAEGIEKQGVAKAVAEEQQGMAKVRVKDADAAGEEKQALVDVKVQVAEAEAIARRGEAESESMRLKARAEADGLREKLDAMNLMDDRARSHEEFRLKLNAELTKSMASIEANKGIAGDQALVLAEALKKANIDIVAGDGNYFDNFVKALSVGKSLDGALDKSDTLKGAAGLLTQFLNRKGDKQDAVQALMSAAQKESA
ncbi:hypothetical protein EOPP23_07920 [Endozoicomonas sp. OPT23]|uniref:flotillin family protein n=1 Tax=Endozoicomonas sp. OPT23 TaxID=2072845 RepID=UPI00129B4179|nr:hypothetical protein [Endozoicomonas sp. OPT23]MRI32910.1 hypothetical protein [Endozoicomonas sp. OPT23]